MLKEHLCAYVISSDWDCNNSCDLVLNRFSLVDADEKSYCYVPQVQPLLLQQEYLHLLE